MRSTSEPARELSWTASELNSSPHLHPQKAARVQQMFAGIARCYDLNNRLHSLGQDQRWRKRAVNLCKVTPQDEVLDVACGTGDLTEAFAAAGPKSVTGLDFTVEMLDLAQQKSKRLRSRGPHGRHNGPNPRYIKGDATCLPFDSNSFDIVSIAFGIRNVADPLAALREFHRVLRPGGRLIVLEFSQPRNCMLRWLNSVYTARIMPITATLIAGDRSGAYRYLPRSVATFFSGAEFEALLISCGFGNVRSHPMTFGVCTAYLADVAHR